MLGSVSSCFADAQLALGRWYVPLRSRAAMGPPGVRALPGRARELPCPVRSKVQTRPRPPMTGVFVRNRCFRTLHIASLEFTPPLSIRPWAGRIALGVYSSSVQWPYTTSLDIFKRTSLRQCGIPWGPRMWLWLCSDAKANLLAMRWRSVVAVGWHSDLRVRVEP